MSRIKGLLPCPFCGGKASIFEFANGWSVDCDNDRCVTQPTLANMFHKKEQAVVAWNTRTDDKRIAELESDKRILMRETAQVRTNNVNNLKWIADLQAQVDRAVLALEPFAHPDLRRLLGGNAQGLESIVFQRNRAILRIGDFIQASTTKQALQEKGDE